MPSGQHDNRHPLKAARAAKGPKRPLRFPPEGVHAPDTGDRMKGDLVAAFIGNTAHPPKKSY